MPLLILRVCGKKGLWWYKWCEDLAEAYAENLLLIYTQRKLSWSSMAFALLQ